MSLAVRTSHQIYPSVYAGPDNTSRMVPGGTCVTCHTAYGTDFGAGHQQEDHALLSGLTASFTAQPGSVS